MLIYVFVQFGGGSHLCLGRNLALFEMNKVLPQLIRRYDLRLVHPGRPLKHNSYHLFCGAEGFRGFCAKAAVIVLGRNQ
jgi:cytochrome P450